MNVVLIKHNTEQSKKYCFAVPDHLLPHPKKCKMQFSVEAHVKGDIKAVANLIFILLWIRQDSNSYENN